MKTVKIYMVRKPSDIDEVMELCRHYNMQAEEVVIAETVNLPPVWYNAVCRNPLDDYIFLSGKGGYDDKNHRQVVALQCPGKPTLKLSSNKKGADYRPLFFYLKIKMTNIFNQIYLIDFQNISSKFGHLWKFIS